MTAKKNVKNSHSGISESNIGADASDYTERRATLDLSDTSPKVNEVNSDDSTEEWAYPLEVAKDEKLEALKDPKESDKEEKMDSSDRGAVGESDDEPLCMWKLQGAKIA